MPIKLVLLGAIGDFARKAPTQQMIIYSSNIIINDI